MPRHPRPWRPTTYRVRWYEADGSESQVVAAGDPGSGTATLALPEDQAVTITTSTGRAMGMVLTHVVFGVLGGGHDGPPLHVEAQEPDGRWHTFKPGASY